MPVSETGRKIELRHETKRIGLGKHLVALSTELGVVEFSLLSWTCNDHKFLILYMLIRMRQGSIRVSTPLLDCKQTN
jgi:hypothetical protein